LVWFFAFRYSPRSTNQFTNSFTNQISFNLFILLFILIASATRLAGSPLHWGPITHPPPSKARASQLRRIKKYYNFNLFERLACLFSWLVAVGQRPAYNPQQSIPLNRQQSTTSSISLISLLICFGWFHWICCLFNSIKIYYNRIYINYGLSFTLGIASNALSTFNLCTVKIFFSFPSAVALITFLFIVSYASPLAAHQFHSKANKVSFSISCCSPAPREED
jgi:hypothetical protein